MTNFDSEKSNIKKQEFSLPYHTGFQLRIKK